MTEYCLQVFRRGTIKTPMTVKRQAQGATLASLRSLNNGRTEPGMPLGPEGMFFTLVLLELRTLGSKVKVVSLVVRCPPLPVMQFFFSLNHYVMALRNGWVEKIGQVSRTSLR